jgi:hypothetical protein
MAKIKVMGVFVFSILGLAVLLAGSDNGRRREFKAELKGINEVGPLGGAISTPGRGSFSAVLSHDGTTVRYRLRYADLEADITQSHIHVGQTHTTGGISVWLCKTDATAASAPADTPFCPDPRNGTVEDEFTAADVIGPSGQGVDAGEFAELIRLMRSGVTYANVHSTKYAPGEIRGQIRED